MKTLEEIINSSHSISDINDIPKDIRLYLSLIGEKCYSSKGVYTVITTLMYYKYLHPTQDIRRHQSQIPDGFSGRSFDTANITPELKRLNLPAMSESGWLTRSLEQPVPYDEYFPGKISGGLKEPFLLSVKYAQENSDKVINMLRIMFNEVFKQVEAAKVKIIPLDNPEILTIDKIMKAIEEHFLFNYGTHNGSKLPVLAFHAIYQSLILEMKRYENCSLQKLSSLTACDRTNKASGDIEVYKNGGLFEAVEIKLDKKIDAQIIRVVRDKIYKYNPQRYYVLSVYGIKKEDSEEIQNIVFEVGLNHGCQIIINGLLPTIKYYLRLITNLKDFVQYYSTAIENDSELQAVHKEKWNELINKLNSQGRA